jgi:hypothetical protein
MARDHRYTHGVCLVCILPTLLRAVQQTCSRWRRFCASAVSVRANAVAAGFAPFTRMQVPTDVVLPLPLPRLVGPSSPVSVALDGTLASALDTDVWLHSSFRAGSLANSLFRPAWDIVLEDHPKASMIRRWLDHGVRPSSYWQHFSGRFGGVDYDVDRPPPRRFANHPSAMSHDPVGPLAVPAVTFVAAQIRKNLASGAIIRWVDHPSFHPDKRPLPHLVLPLGVEPGKPRLIYDARYLNLWQREIPFRMEGLPQVPHLAFDGAFMWTLDHHSGFHHIPIAPDEQTYFGFEDTDGVVYVCTTMPFGWAHAPLIYNVMTHAAVSLLRQLGLRNVYYTDDIFGTSHQKGSLSTLWNSANVSAFLHTFVFTTLGYFLSPKTIPIPSQQSLFLGLMVDSVQRRFTVPFHKMWKFLALVQAVFNDDGVTRRDLERIAGRAVSFSLAIPGALFFTRGMYRALTETRHQAASFMITASQLKLAESDLIAWLDLPIWVDTSVSSWPRQHHATIVMYSDASSGTEGRGATTSGGVIRGVEPAWGGTLHLPGSEPKWAAGVFPFEHRHRHINELEVLARYYTLRAFAHLLRGARVLSAIDNTVARRYFNRDGGGNEFSNGIARLAFDLQRQYDFHTDRVGWVASADNPSDEPSRIIDRGDYRLRSDIFHWLDAHSEFGSRHPCVGFTIDWMASHRNAQCTRRGRLPFYSRYFDISSAGVDFFAQQLMHRYRCVNGYINPPWVLMQAVVDYLKESRARGTLIVPQQIPPPAWWPMVIAPEFALAMVCLVRAGEPDVFMHPSSDYERALGPTPFAVWAIAFDLTLEP